MAALSEADLQFIKQASEKMRKRLTAILEDPKGAPASFLCYARVSRDILPELMASLERERFIDQAALIDCIEQVVSTIFLNVALTLGRDLKGTRAVMQMLQGAINNVSLEGAEVIIQSGLNTNADPTTVDAGTFFMMENDCNCATCSARRVKH